MNKKDLTYILIFLFGLQLLLYWIFWLEWRFIILWLINTILIISFYLFYIKDDGVNLDFLKNIKFNDKKYINKNILNNYLNIFEYYNKHYIFFIVSIILVLAITNTLFINKYDINIVLSTTIFLISFIFNIKNLYKWDFFVWQKKVSVKDFLFISNILLIFIVFSSLENMIFVNKLLLSFVIWIVFYIFSIFSLWFVSNTRKLIKDIFIKIYAICFFILIFSFAWQNYDWFKNFFIKEIEKEKIVYKEIPLENDQTINNENNSIDFVQNFVAPNWKNYDIYKDKWLYFFYNEDWLKINFDNLEELLQLLTNINPSNQNINNDEIIENENNDEKDALVKWLENLLEWENNNIDLLENNIIEAPENKDEALTYKYIIPYIVKKYLWVNENLADINFDNISNDSDIYPYFLTARSKKMIWTDINPNIQVRCKNYVVILWLAMNWDVQYTAQNVFDEFWKEWENRSMIPKWCQADDFITLNMLDS